MAAVRNESMERNRQSRLLFVGSADELSCRGGGGVFQGGNKLVVRVISFHHGRRLVYRCCHFLFVARSCIKCWPLQKPMEADARTKGPFHQIDTYWDVKFVENCGHHHHHQQQQPATKERKSPLLLNKKEYDQVERPRHTHTLCIGIDRQPPFWPLTAAVAVVMMHYLILNPVRVECVFLWSNCQGNQRGRGKEENQYTTTTTQRPDAK